MHTLIPQYLSAFHRTHGKALPVSLDYRQGAFVFGDGITVSEDQLRVMLRTVEQMAPSTAPITTSTHR